MRLRLLALNLKLAVKNGFNAYTTGARSYYKHS